MKPLQFYQLKSATGWTSMKATKNITALTSQLELRKKNHRNWTLNWQKTRKTIASLLYEYYEILFNPDNRNIFREPYLKDLSLLLPTNETISITPKTNFILLPLPLPTYRERTDRAHKRFMLNCPFLKYYMQPEVNEFVRDMDYGVDSDIWMLIAKPHNPRWNKIKDYPHTNHLTKIQWTNQPLSQTEARIWTYKYQDVPNYIAETMPRHDADVNTSTSTSAQWHSLIDWIDSKDERVVKRRNKSYQWRNANKIYKQRFVYRKYTLLEIPTQAPDQNNYMYYTLDKYSKAKLTDTMFTRDTFAKFFDFNLQSKPLMLAYFMKHAVPMNEFSVPEIRSGITRLKNIIKYWSHKEQVQSQPQPDHPQPQPQLQQHWRPTREYLYTHWVKWYKPDWTVTEFETHDDRETYKKSKDELLLSSNNNQTWSQQ